jgi:hypothetical protein
MGSLHIVLEPGELAARQIINFADETANIGDPSVSYRGAAAAGYGDRIPPRGAVSDRSRTCPG